MRTISHEEASLVAGAGLWSWFKSLFVTTPSSGNSIGHQGGAMAVVVVSGRKMTRGQEQAYDTWLAAQAAPGCTVTTASNDSVSQTAIASIAPSIGSTMTAGTTTTVICK